MKDLESLEHRAMEREMLRVAREQKRTGGDRVHIALGIILLIAAIVLQLIGYSGVAVLVLVGLFVEMVAYVVLSTNRPMPRVETPPVSTAPKPEDSGR